MAVTDSYSTVETYRSVVDKTDAGNDPAVLDDLRAVSRYLDGRLGRFFTQEPAVARTYETPPPRSFGLSEPLPVDDLVSVTEIILDEDNDGLFTDETALATTDYSLWPLNAALGPEPRPYVAIELPRWTTRFTTWPSSTRVRITGTWGWPAVPKAIERATIHLTAILRLESPRATQRVNELGEVLSTSRQAQLIINDLAYEYERRRVYA